MEYKRIQKIIENHQIEIHLEYTVEGTYQIKYRTFDKWFRLYRNGKLQKSSKELETVVEKMKYLKNLYSVVNK